MPDSLGDALLYLRTDDSGFTAGVGAAEGKAVQLGATLDATSAKSGGLSTALSRTGVAAQSASRELDTAATSSARLAASGAAVTKMSGAQAMGLRQLTQNIGDMSTMYALGMRPQQIFASQIGQVAQAIQLTAGEGSKFASILTGPVGIAIMLAVQLFGPFIGKLFEASNQLGELQHNLDQSAKAADGLKDSQSLLGKVVDDTTGKLKTQNRALIEHVRLQAQASLLKAKQDEIDARDALGGIGKPSLLDRATAFVNGSSGYLADAKARYAPLQKLADEVKAGKMTDPVAIGRAVDALQKSGALKGIPDAKLVDITNTLIGMPTARADQSYYQDVINKIDAAVKAGYQPPAKGSRGSTKTGGTAGAAPGQAQDAARNAAELARLGEEETRARLDLTTNVEDRADLQMDLLNQERDQRVREIESDKNLSADEKKARLAYIKALYGSLGGPSKTDANGNIVVTGDDGGAYGRKIAQDLRRQEMRLANDALARQADALTAQAGIATNLKDRNALERRALELQQQIERNTLDEQIAGLSVADKTKAVADLKAKQAAQIAGLLRAQEGPLAQYQDAIRATAENMDTEVEAIEVRGLQNLNDGLADAIVGAKSLGDVFHNVAQQIIGDLLRIAIQQQVIKPLAEMLGLNSGGGGGLLGAIGGLLGLGGGGSGVLGSGFNVGGIDTGIAFGGFRAAGGPVRAGLPYIVGEKRPEIFVPDQAGVILPDARAAAGRGSAGRTVVEVRVMRGELFDATVERISGEVSVQVVRGAAEPMINAAVAETARQLDRSRL